MKCISKKIVFVCFALVFAPTECDHVDRVNITCVLRSAPDWQTTTTYSLNVGVDKIKDSYCPRNSTKLKDIHIEGTIKVLYEDSFKDIINFAGIELQNAGLEELQPGTFKDFPELQRVILLENRLTEIKTGTFVNLRLTALNLDRNFISVLQPGAFQNVSITIQLQLYENRLTEIRQGVFQNVSVRDLILSRNGISRIEPGAFAGLHAVYSTMFVPGICLYLSDNSIKRLDPQVFDNEEIRTLDLINSSISILRSGDLNNLPNLRVLYLCRNGIKEVPEGVFNGSKIEVLDLSQNEISVIANGAFDGMTRLRKFVIYHNKLKEWDGGWFRGLPVATISASYNDIEVICAESFVDVPEGIVVKLDHNKIRNISDGAFVGLRSLKDLDLSYNEISEWKIDFLKKVFIRFKVDLRGNKINCSEMEPELQKLPARGVIYLDCLIMYNRFPFSDMF
ncbi:hypothetical protein Zmor_018939 [Zophobas morio]|uniref:Uncharacterized protein n=1 Tax=Zophobas morio TaxID=2755281 RepID=A0AA38IC68_9CUCU|nr:hypothetical protein Zmor_018939 [Zophobas morio]